MSASKRGPLDSIQPGEPNIRPVRENPNLLARLTRSLIFHEPAPSPRPDMKPSRYRRMWRNTVATVGAVAILPLITMTAINYFLYRRSFREQMTDPIERVATLSKRTLESFLKERIAAERYVLSRESGNELFENGELPGVFERMRKAFGGIVDVGVIDSDGTMRAYAGPYDLQNKTYDDQEWFRRMERRDTYVSDVFLGHRKVPHFVIAVRRQDRERDENILRATIDTHKLNEQLSTLGLGETSDAFIINREGVLQTPSHLFGPPLDQFPGPVPPESNTVKVQENVRLEGASYVMAYAYVEQSPFIVLILSNRRHLVQGWLTYQTEVLLLLTASIVVIILIIMSITSNWVGRIRLYELRREATLHKAEHNTKMASIGRLAAGVAHEINNPLAIINEKAGLMRDILLATPDVPRGEKLMKQIDSILGSVKRCKDITHRLLGFARHIDVKEEQLAVEGIVRDVLAFLEKEADHKRINIHLCIPQELPMILSDKGQLQQLFLNLVNNAFDAVDRGGNIVIDLAPVGDRAVEVAVMDDGCGIPKEHLDRVFDPFFTTKQSKGTGLGLSISYGIVKKLKGSMKVESEEGVGTTFVIRLPVDRRLEKRGNG